LPSTPPPPWKPWLTPDTFLLNPFAPAPRTPEGVPQGVQPTVPQGVQPSTPQSDQQRAPEGIQLPKGDQQGALKGSQFPKGDQFSTGEAFTRFASVSTPPPSGMMVPRTFSINPFAPTPGTSKAQQPEQKPSVQTADRRSAPSAPDTWKQAVKSLQPKNS